MKKRLFLLLFFFTIIFNQLANAQDVKAVTKLDSSRILIGDQVTMQLSLTLPKDYKFRWTDIPDTLGGKVEIVSKSGFDTVFSPDQKLKTISQKIVLTSFDSGFYSIPSFRFAYQKPNDTSTLFAETEASLLNVLTIPVDTTKNIKDIKPPISAPITFTEILPWLGGGIILIAIIFLVIYFLKRRKKKLPLIRLPQKPPTPPHIVALETLESLKSRKLWQNGQFKEYHTAITDIIRKYIEERYNIGAIEMTSDEILSSFNSALINDSSMEKLRQVLLIADLVKFAKEEPLPVSNEQNIMYAIEFVKATIPVLETKDVSAVQNQNSDSISVPLNNK